MVSYELRRYGDSVNFFKQSLESRVRPLDDLMRAETERSLARSRNLVAELTIDMEPKQRLCSPLTAQWRNRFPGPLLLDVGSTSARLEAQRDTCRSTAP